jgi:hypothetical protein
MQELQIIKLKMRIFLLLLLSISQTSYAQEDLEALLEDSIGKPQKEYVRGTFKGTRVINLHSVEKAALGSLQFLIQHRFGALNGGAYNLYGLDQATIRFALEYGISKFLMVGVGRSSYQKTYDGFVKASLIRQSRGANSVPISVLYFGSTAVNTMRWDDPVRDNHFSSRLSYVHQIIIGSKVNENFSFEIVPTVVHKNLVAKAIDQNNFYSIGAGFRYKFGKRTSFNLEYIYRIPPKDKSAPSYANFYNSLSVGFDIETGGHVFQLHLTNSLPMIEKAFITETSEKWGDGGIHFGFNISRDFVLHKTKSKE